MSGEEMKFTDILDVPYFYDDLWMQLIDEFVNKNPKSKKTILKHSSERIQPNELLIYLEKYRKNHGGMF